MGVNNSGLNVFAGAPPEPEKGIGRVFWEATLQPRFLAALRA